jgi:hypothetical protein
MSIHLEAWTLDQNCNKQEFRINDIISVSLADSIPPKADNAGASALEPSSVKLLYNIRQHYY